VKNLNDKGLGSLIVVLSLIFMVGYFVWAFAPYIGFSSWISPGVSEWAYKLPVIFAVYVILLIILWIGYTMAITPPPIPLDNPLDIEREDVSSIDDEEKADN